MAPSFRVLSDGWLHETAASGIQALIRNKREAPPGDNWCDELIFRHPDPVSPHGDVTLGAPAFDSLAEALTPPAEALTPPAQHDVYSVVDRAMADLRRALGNMTYPRADGGTISAAELLGQHLKAVEVFVAVDADRLARHPRT